MKKLLKIFGVIYTIVIFYLMLAVHKTALLIMLISVLVIIATLETYHNSKFYRINKLKAIENFSRDGNSRKIIKIALRSFDRKVCQAAIEKLDTAENQAVLAEIAVNDTDCRIRKMSMERLFISENQPTFAEIALNDTDFDMRLNAVEKLDVATQEDIIAKISLRENNWEIAKTAAAKLTPKKLNKIVVEISARAYFNADGEFIEWLFSVTKNSYLQRYNGCVYGKKTETFVNADGSVSSQEISLTVNI